MSHKGCFYQNIKVKSIYVTWRVVFIKIYKLIALMSHEGFFIKIYKLIALMSHKGCFYQNIQVNSFDVT